MPIAMEESSNYECSESHQSGGFFAVTKERRALMYAKLDKLREDLKKAVAKREAADAKVKQLEAKLKEEENQQIVSDVASYNLSPEQLAQFLQLANSGRLQEMLSGQVPMPGAVNADTSGKKQDEDNETDMDKEEEDFLDEENEKFEKRERSKDYGRSGNRNGSRCGCVTGYCICTESGSRMHL